MRSLALQSTGGDGAPCLRFSNSRGWRWYLVSAQHTTNVPGRKSDVEECHRPFCCLSASSFILLSQAGKVDSARFRTHK